MTLRVVIVAGAAAILAACASAGGTSAHRVACDLPDRDSVFAVGGPVFRDCAVDRAARLVTTNIHPDFRPTTPRSTCYSADVEFVVDTIGKIETRTARVIRTNDQTFAESVVASLTAWKYDPAVRDKRLVRQVVTTHQTMSTGVVVAPKGMPPPSGPPMQRPPSC